MGDGTRLETGRAMSLEGSTPSPSAVRGIGPRTTPGFQPGDRVDSRSRTPNDGWSLAERSEGFQARQAGSTPRSRESANGRLPDFESGGGGSNPPSRTPGQLLLVVTPRSERGGRWFDSSPRNSVQAFTEAIRPDEEPVLKTGGGLGRLWVRVPRLPPRGPRYANGRAARLKPGRLWVRLPPWVLGHGCKCLRLGRQPADHSRLEREMLRVRIPPEPSHVTPSWSSLECSPPCHGEIAGSNPVGGAGVRWMARYANRQSDQAQTRGFCGFDSHPCYSRLDCSGGVPHGGL